MRREAVVEASAMGEERRGGETARRCRLSGKKMEWIRGRGARAAGQRPGSEDDEAGNFVFSFLLGNGCPEEILWATLLYLLCLWAIVGLKSLHGMWTRTAGTFASRRGSYTPPKSARISRRTSRRDVECTSFSYIKEGPREERST
jgi:hypothetical protein